eukprot:9263218-Pyramimonas_sp.AAC.1
MTSASSNFTDLTPSHLGLHPSKGRTFWTGMLIGLVQGPRCPAATSAGADALSSLEVERGDICPAMTPASEVDIHGDSGYRR